MKDYITVTYRLKDILSLHVTCEILICYAFTPAFFHTSTPTQTSQKQTPTKILMELSPPQKLLNSGPSRVTRSLYGEVLTSSPFNQKKNQRTVRTKNNFIKMVHTSNSSNSEKNDDRDNCKECKEYYYVMKQECGWIKCSVCEKWLHENCTIFSKTCSDCGHNNRFKNLEKT